MTSYTHTATFSDGELITIERALAMLEQHSAARIVANDFTPATHDLATIPKIREKINAGAAQRSGYDPATGTISLDLSMGGLGDGG